MTTAPLREVNEPAYEADTARSQAVRQQGQAKVENTGGVGPPGSVLDEWATSFEELPPPDVSGWRPLAQEIGPQHSTPRAADQAEVSVKKSIQASPELPITGQHLEPKRAWSAGDAAAAVPRASLQKRIWAPSDQIHVLGVDIRGVFVANALAGCGTLPSPRLLIHCPFIWERWTGNGRQIILHRGNQWVARNRIIAEWASYYEEHPRDAAPPSEEPITNLVITVPAISVSRAFRQIVHRVDASTTICLIQDGLGVAEKLIEDYFPSIIKRPRFILGHLTHRLGYGPHQFEMALVQPGKLYLTLYRPDMLYRPDILSYRPGRIRLVPSMEATLRGTHMARLLTATPELHGCGHCWEDWLQKKLPMTVFRAIVDPLSDILDMPCHEIARDSHATMLVDNLLGEICSIILQLPETKNRTQFARYHRDGALRGRLINMMMRRRFFSDEHVATKRGFESDVDFLLGYFVKRAKEIGARCATLQTMLSLAKTRHAVALKKRRREVPFDCFEGESQTEARNRDLKWLANLRPGDLGLDSDLLPYFPEEAVAHHDAVERHDSFTLESKAEESPWFAPRSEARRADSHSQRPTNA